MSWPIEYGIIWLYSGVAQYNIAAVVKCIDFGGFLKFLQNYGSHPKFKYKGKKEINGSKKCKAEENVLSLSLLRFQMFYDIFVI